MLCYFVGIITNIGFTITFGHELSRNGHLEHLLVWRLAAGCMIHTTGCFKMINMCFKLPVSFLEFHITDTHQKVHVSFSQTALHTLWKWEEQVTNMTYCNFCLSDINESKQTKWNGKSTVWSGTDAEAPEHQAANLYLLHTFYKWIAFYELGAFLDFEHFMS